MSFDKKYDFKVLGPAGLSRADLMYHWNLIQFSKANGNRTICLLCQDKVRGGEIIRVYKENGRKFSTHEVCFQKYYELIFSGKYWFTKQMIEFNQTLFKSAL